MTALLGLGILASGGFETRPVRVPDPVPAVAAAPAAPARLARAGPDLGPLPRSLRGTTPPVGLVVDAAGDLVPTPALHALFEHFLAASGEESPATIRARIVAELEERLPPRAARQGEALLDLYLAYREALRELDDARLAASADLERRLQWLRETRREIFGADVADALFGTEEDALRVALEQRRVAADPSLDAETRRARLEELETRLPEPVRAAREAALAPLRLIEEEAALRDAGASDAEIQALHERRLGPEAAARLEAMDRSRAEWEQRVTRYRAERGALDADAGASPAARADALEALRVEHFGPEELTRVRALDGAEALR